MERKSSQNGVFESIETTNMFNIYYFGKYVGYVNKNSVIYNAIDKSSMGTCHLRELADFIDSLKNESNG